MILHLSMILFMGGGRHVWQGVCAWQGGMHSGGMHGRRYVWHGGHVWQRGMCGRVCVCVAGGLHAAEMATEADGMHPTGMHSSFLL